MKLYKFSLLMLVLGSSAFAQTQKFTMAEAVNGLRTNLAVKNISQFSWSGDGKSYIQAVKGGYLITDLKTNKQDTLVSLTQLNRGLTDSKFKAVPQIKFISNSKGYFNKEGKVIWVEKSGSDWKMKSQVEIDQNASDLKVFGDNQTFAFTVKNNLFVNKNGKTIAVTNDSDENILNGSSNVHRNEFGIDTGIFPAPNSESVAFYRMDQTMVADYPIIDWSVTPAVNHNIKYPMAGQTSHQVTLGVFNIRTQSTTFLNIEGEKDQYLTAVTWSPDSKYIFVGVLDRGQNHMKMNQYDAVTGNLVKTLFEETSDKYVEPQHPLTFFPNSNTDFIWQSQRTGYNHLFHYNIEKGLVAQITKGDWLVTDILGFNEKKKEIYLANGWRM
ncbi:MAG: DPP IV N-terminal domain-containing protein [Chryseobacterium taeanense]